MKIEIPSGNLTSIDRWFSDSTLHFDRRFPSQGCLIPRGYLQSWGYQGKAFPHSKFQARIFTDSICFGGICNCETFQEMKVDLNDPNTTGTSTPSPGADNSIVQAWFKPRKDVTWRLMMSSSILHHHVVMPARHWNNLFVPLRKCCAKMFDHETMQPFRLNCSLKPNPMDGRFQPPNISGFLKWGYPKSSQSDFNNYNFGIDTRPDWFWWILRVPHFEMFKKPPRIIPCL